jgi:hypothetical protein
LVDYVWMVSRKMCQTLEKRKIRVQVIVKAWRFSFIPRIIMSHFLKDSCLDSGYKY